jgi:prophage regulatory protein
MRVLACGDLRGKGIRFSRQWIVKLVALGKFPAPIRLGEQSVAFVEAEIDEWLEARIRERDEKSGSNVRITSEIEPPSTGNGETSGTTLTARAAGKADAALSPNIPAPQVSANPTNRCRGGRRV